MSSSSSRLGLFETRYSDFEALSWNRPPKARARRRRSERSSSRVVVENDAVIERRFDLRPGFELDAVQRRPDIAQCLDPHLQTEGDFERAFARARAFQFHLVGVPVHPHENLRQRDVFLRVEIGREILEGENLVADQDALPGINAAKAAAQERPAADRDRLGAVVLEQDQVVIAKGEEPVVAGETLQNRHRPCPLAPKEIASSGDAPR